MPDPNDPLAPFLNAPGRIVEERTSRRLDGEMVVLRREERTTMSSAGVFTTDEHRQLLTCELGGCAVEWHRLLVRCGGKRRGGCRRHVCRDCIVPERCARCGGTICMGCAIPIEYDSIAGVQIVYIHRQCTVVGRLLKLLLRRR